ncbi:hypothetical protein RJI07_02945 [Mycoplasmatota bacterium WC30]
MKKENAAKQAKKVHSNLYRWLRFLISVFLILSIGYLVLNYVPFIAKYDSYVIGSGSMEPVIMTGDAVIIDTHVSLDDLAEEDIIAFYADVQGDETKEVIVHYLDSISDVDGVRVFKTRPEVSDQVDSWDLLDEDIVGIHVLTISKIGSFLLFAQSTIGRIVLIADILIIYIIVEAFSKPKNSKKKIVKNEITEKPEETL